MRENQAARRTAALAALLALAAFAAGGSAAQAQAPSLDWSSQNLNLDNNRFAPLDEIDGMTVGRAVAAAGGYADGGSPEELQIQRMVEGRVVSRVVTEDEPVQPDDVIMVRGRAVERPERKTGSAHANAQNYRRDGRAVPPAPAAHRRPDA